MGAAEAAAAAAATGVHRGDGPGSSEGEGAEGSGSARSGGAEGAGGPRHPADAAGPEAPGSAAVVRRSSGVAPKLAGPRLQSASQEAQGGWSRPDPDLRPLLVADACVCTVNCELYS